MSQAAENYGLDVFVAFTSICSGIKSTERMLVEANPVILQRSVYKKNYSSIERILVPNSEVDLHVYMSFCVDYKLNVLYARNRL